MRKQCENWLKESIIIYSIIYTITTISSSTIYLFLGIRDDPSGNWHEITRALIVLIGVLVYELAKHLPIKNVMLRTLVVYIVTLGCAFFVVWSTQFIEPLAKSAYEDIFINYTGLLLTISILILIVNKIKHRE